MTVTEQQKQIAWTVVARFINLREPTHRKVLLRKFKNADAINQLLNRSFFNSVQTDVYLPLPMAFENCGDADFLTKARQATEVALRVLQNLDEAHPEKQNGDFTLEEFIAHAARMYDQKPDEAMLLLGLKLSTNFGIFTHWSGHSLNSFGFHENIVTIDPALAWDDYIREREAANKSVQERSTNLPELDFHVDLTGADLALTAPNPSPLKPTGNYDYHPEIKRVSDKLLSEGNFRQAVLDAFIHVIAMVKERTKLPHEGDDLMNRAFSPDNRIPPVRFNDFRTEADKSEQRGIWNLFKGVVGLRNFKAHIVSVFDDPQRAHEYLALASLLMRWLDMANFGTATQPQGASVPSQAAKPAKREKLVEIYGQGAGPGAILISGSEASIQPGTTALSRLVTVVNKAQQPVRITAKRLLVDGTEWPLEALFFQNLKSRAKDKAISVAGNVPEDYKLYFLVSTTNLPRDRAGIVEFQIDENEETLRVNVQFPSM